MAGARNPRESILDAAAAAYAERSVAHVGREDVAWRAGVSKRAVAEVGADRVALLRQIVDELAFPPTARMIAAQAAHPTEPALQALLRAARQVLGDPGAAWDPVELQAIAIAPYDEALRSVVGRRLDTRWDAAEIVVRQLRRGDRPEPADEAAVLHLLAVGLGLAMLSPLAPRWSDPAAWSALSARMLETLAGVDAEPLAGAMQRWRARVTMPAAPSSMAAMLRVLARLGVHVVSLFTATLDDERQLVDMFLTSAADTDRSTVVHGLSSAASDVIVTRGIPEDAEDVATRVLRLSARLAAEPEAAPRAAADLVLADSWEVTAAVEGADASALVLRLQWTPERHVVLRRVKAPFTVAERDRASALLSLVAALAQARGDADGFGWRETLRDGESVGIRLARPADADRVERMHGRCSEQTRFQRYFTPMNEWREDNLRRIAGGHRGTTLVAADASGQVVALGNVFPSGPEESDSAEIAVIVEDDWHGRGLGLALTLRLVDVARRMGFGRLVAYVLAENTAMINLLGRTGLTWEPTSEHDFGPTVVALTAAI